jgi:hypothetical protein
MYTDLTLAALPLPRCASLLPRPRPAAAGGTRVLSALMEQRPVHLDERDAKYNQRRMVATEVGSRATFSAATLIVRKINRAKRGTSFSFDYRYWAQMMSVQSGGAKKTPCKCVFIAR